MHHYFQISPMLTTFPFTGVSQSSTAVTRCCPCEATFIVPINSIISSNRSIRRIGLNVRSIFRCTFSLLPPLPPSAPFPLVHCGPGQLTELRGRNESLSRTQHNLEFLSVLELH